MSKPLATKVNTPLSENVQIGPKESIFCVATFILQHCLNSLGHGVHQSFTGCHWSPLPLLHDDITELVNDRDLALLHLPFEDAHRCSIGFRSGDMLGQSITFTLWLLNNARLRLCCQLGLDSFFFSFLFLLTVFVVLYLLYSTLVQLCCF